VTTSTKAYISQALALENEFKKKKIGGASGEYAENP
jgi:hypothetical protein